MRKKFIFSLFVGFVFISSTAMANDVVPEEIPAQGQMVRQLKSPNAYQLYVVAPFEIPNASNGPVHGPLYMKAPQQKARLIASDAVIAKPIPKDKTYFVDHQFSLFVTDPKGNIKKLAERVYGDFSFNGDYSRMVVSRPTTMEPEENITTIELLDSNGSVIREIVPAGDNSMPMFTPDGKKILYVCADTGIVSWYIVNIDGTNRRQLTNIGMEFLDDSFVPIPSTYEHAEFIDNTHFKYLDDKDIWILDITTGKALKKGTL